MKKIKFFGLFLAFSLMLSASPLQASLTEQSVDEMSSNIQVSPIKIVHNPNIDEYEKIASLYQKYYASRENKSIEDILESYKKLVALPGFNFIAAFDNATKQYVGFMNFGHAPDQFQSPRFLYRTILDSAYVENTEKELEIYKILFMTAEELSRNIKSHRMVAKTGSNDFEQEKRLFSSNMNAFPCPEKGRIFFEYYLDK